MTQSRSRAISASSPACLVREKSVSPPRSTPIAETWMTRRTPPRSQASHKAAGPSRWVAAVESRALSCSTPAQFTTASMPAR